MEKQCVRALHAQAYECNIYKPPCQMNQVLPYFLLAKSKQSLKAKNSILSKLLGEYLNGICVISCDWYLYGKISKMLLCILVLTLSNLSTIAFFAQVKHFRAKSRDAQNLYGNDEILEWDDMIVWKNHFSCLCHWRLRYWPVEMQIWLLRPNCY